MMKLQLNGQAYDCAKETTVLGILADKKLEPSTVIVELNRTLLSADELPGVPLQDGDVLEIIRFVGGG